MKRTSYNPAAEIIAALSANIGAEKIRVYFKGGKEAVYTMRIFGILKTDPAVEFITSEETGEIIFGA